MLARRKPQDGFEWQRYVRTTLRLRRAVRRRRFEEARRAIRRALAAAPRVVVAGVRRGLTVVLASTAAAALALALRMGGLASRALSALRPRLARALAFARRGFAAVGDPALAQPIAVAGVIALLAGVVRLGLAAAGVETATMLALGALLLAPELARRYAQLTAQGRGALALRLAGLLVLVAAGLAALWAATRAASPWIEAHLGWGPTGAQLTGKARALSGDTLRIRGRTVRLAGIRVPAGQCRKPSRRSSCAAVGHAALAQLVADREVRCTLTGRDREGAARASCAIAGKDLAAELLRQGVVSAEPVAARVVSKGAAGLDRVGVWEAAKRRAPGGCPIKGLVRRDGRIYVLPGDPSYALRRVREARGERWFCSEQEAQAAGFKAEKRS